MTTQSALLSPIKLGRYELPNRMVMAPLTRNRAGDGNVPHELNALYYAQRASAGLIVSEATQISPQGVGYPATPGIHSAEQVEGWKIVTKAVHDRGGRALRSHPRTAARRRPLLRAPASTGGFRSPRQALTVFLDSGPRASLDLVRRELDALEIIGGRGDPDRPELTGNRGLQPRLRRRLAVNDEGV